jgi:diadenosine tetraphosphate (Ap4A) HIT family hydrolase
MKDCIFCKLVNGEIPSYKIWEDENYMAILDIYPNIAGQSLVIPKAHIDSNVFAMKVPEYDRFMKATRKVARLLEKKLKVGRVHLVFEGTAINHLHAKLYPAIGYGKEFIETVVKEEIKFERYPGYVTTLMGPRAGDDELSALQRQIAGK